MKESTSYLYLVEYCLGGKIISIGVDLVSIKRFKRECRGNPRLKAKLFTSNELKLSAQQLAGNFAIKEALYKALDDQTSFRYSNCSILRDFNSGKPKLILDGELALLLKNKQIGISITNEGDWVIACVSII